MGMREHLATMLEKFRPTLETCNEFSEPQVELILALIDESFKAGHNVGLANFADIGAVQIENVLRTFAEASLVADTDLDINAACGLYFACNSVGPAIADSIRDALRNELH